MNKALILLAIVGMVGCNSVAAVGEKPITAVWDRNTEDDMDHYQMYSCAGVGCTVMQNAANRVGADIPQTAVGVEPTITLDLTGDGAIAVSAVDHSGNESTLSNQAAFDRVAPGTPQRLRIK